MRRPIETYQESSLPGNRAIGGLFAIILIIIVVIAAASFFSSLSGPDSLASDLGNSARQAIGLDRSGDEPAVNVPEAPPEPVGDATWVLTQEDLNQRIRARESEFSPASDVNVEFEPGIVTVRFRAYGVDGTYHGSLTTRNGVPVVADSTVDGPVGWFVDSGEIDQVLNEEMARAVNEQNISVESVRVEQGQIVMGVSGA